MREAILTGWKPFPAVQRTGRYVGDTFAFAPGGGADEIRNFEPGADKVDLTAFDLARFRQIVRETADDGSAIARVRGGDAVVEFDGLAWRELGRDDFVL